MMLINARGPCDKGQQSIQMRPKHPAHYPFHALPSSKRCPQLDVTIG